MAHVGIYTERQRIGSAIPSDQIFHLEANGDCLYNLRVLRDFFAPQNSVGITAVFTAACPELGMEMEYYYHKCMDTEEYFVYENRGAELMTNLKKTCIFLGRRFILAELRDAAARAVQLERIATKKKCQTVAVDTAEKAVVLDKADVEAYIASLHEDAEEEKPQRPKADGSMSAYKD